MAQGNIRPEQQAIISRFQRNQAKADALYTGPRMVGPGKLMQDRNIGKVDSQFWEQ